MALLTDAGELADHCARWRQLDFIAIDTEFMRSDTYYAKLGLVQILADDSLVLIDPGADGVAEALAPVLADSSVIKVLHAGSEDLQVLARYSQVTTAPVFDTQLAAAFCGHGFSLSYSKLVEALCGVQLDKGETRSDWLQRPLTNSQLKYASDDVAYLPSLYARLRQALQQLDRSDWLMADCNSLALAAVTEPPIDTLYQKMARAWQLSGTQLLALKILCARREQIAVERNRPRNWILKDKTLWELARCLPDNKQALTGIPELAPAQLRRHGDLILDCIHQAIDADESQWPASLPPPAGKPYSAIAKLLRKSINDTAQRLNLAPELLARKKDIEHLLVSHSQTGIAELSDTLSGWRAEVIGHSLRNQVNAHFGDAATASGLA